MTHPYLYFDEICLVMRLYFICIDYILLCTFKCETNYFLKCNVLLADHKKFFFVRVLKSAL